MEDIQLAMEEERREATENDPSVRAKWAMHLLMSAIIRVSVLLGIVFLLCIFYAPQLFGDLVISIPVTMFWFTVAILSAKFTKLDFTRLGDWHTRFVDDLFDNTYTVICIIVLLVDLWLMHKQYVFSALIGASFLLSTQLIIQVKLTQQILGGRNVSFTFDFYNPLLMNLTFRILYTYLLVAFHVIMVNHNEYALIKLFR